MTAKVLPWWVAVDNAASILSQIGMPTWQRDTITQYCLIRTVCMQKWAIADTLTRNIARKSEPRTKTLLRSHLLLSVSSHAAHAYMQYVAMSNDMNTMPGMPASPAAAPPLLKHAIDPVIGAAELDFCQRKSVGTLLGLMVGNVLGSAVQHGSAEKIYKHAPSGLTEFQQTKHG